MYLTDTPRYVPLENYESAIARMIDRICKEDGVCSIYQLGSVGSPGISDIDLLVVCEDGWVSRFRPLLELSKEDRYLFTHSLFGVSRHFFRRAQWYTTLFQNHQLRWGEPLEIKMGNLCNEETEALKRQLALEYLLVNFIAKTIDRSMGMLSVRKLFLTIKGLRYDLECLGVNRSPLYELVSQCMEWRTAWFENPIAKSQIKRWFVPFYQALHQTLAMLLKEENLFFPSWIGDRFAKTVLVKPGPALAYIYTGIALPALPGKRYQKLRRRLHRYTFSVPITRQCPDPVLEERFAFLRELKRYNAHHLPHFADLDGQLGRLIPAH